MYDAIVVGGGVVGLSAAYHLVRGGASTLLLDRGDEGRASDAGAGILSSMSVIDDPDPLERLKARAAHDYPELIELLRADGAGDTGYAVTGSLTVALSADEVAPFARTRAMSGGGHVELAAERARALFPPLGPVRGALHATGDARIDGRCSPRRCGEQRKRAASCCGGRASIACWSETVASGASRPAPRKSGPGR